MSEPPNLRVNLNRFLEVIPLRRKTFSVADQPDYSSPCFLKPDFARISSNKNIAKSKHCVATFAYLEKIECTALTLVARQSQSYLLCLLC